MNEIMWIETKKTALKGEAAGVPLAGVRKIVKTRIQNMWDKS